MSVKEKMTAIADAIRTKTGRTELLTLDGMAEATAGIHTGIGDYTNEQMMALFHKTVTDFVIPNGVTRITSVLQGNTNLTNVTIPDSVTRIDVNAFSGCTKLEIAVLPETVTVISSTAFQGTAVSFHEFPAGITAFGNGAFADCLELTEITFKGKPNNIPANTFVRCTNITVINCPWAEGEVANAPWGATNATINYNYALE